MYKSKQLLFILVILNVGYLFGIALFSDKLTAQQLSRSETFEGYPMEDAVIRVAETTGKAVVAITVEQVQRVGGVRRFYFGFPEDSPFGSDDPFRRFFEDFFGEIPQREYRRIGVGSGVIIDPQGYILTNQHVVEGAEKIKVILPDGREFKAELKGQDVRSDLAVIKINARNLPVAVLGDSDKLKIGQWVVAIGNPFGLAMQNPEPTVTIGVISALHRSLGRTLARERDYNDLIQTDAAINPGNSGGPLVNLKGEVIGINVAIYSTSGGYQGIGFAVPINSARRILSRLIEGKKVEYGWLGVTVQDMTEDLATYFGLSEKKGVLIAGVLAGGPAQKAGMKKGDILIEFDNKKVNSVKELLSFMNNSDVGKKVRILVLRDKKEIPLEVVLGSRPEQVASQQITEEQLPEDKEQSGTWRGMEVAEVSSSRAKQFGMSQTEGVVVVKVKEDSPAADAGIMPGDIILEINHQRISSVNDFNRITRFLKGDCLVATARGFVIVKEKSEK
ncbi:MAG: Do family serine endopeptidase [Candidatus Omnitrophica bacterium]|nr:Do family serine endopeptidase [Candidatus Omnitrophota bacterium]